MTLSKILKIMEFALLNPEKYTEEEVKNKFKPKDYELFSQFCLGGPHNEQLAQYPGQTLKLTQRGVREYHKLRSEKSQRNFNILMLLTTIVLAVSSSIMVLLSWLG